jgi:hypothetical protein
VVSVVMVLVVMVLVVMESSVNGCQ